jgi:ureidoacrylate peracid hydrolase
MYMFTRRPCEKGKTIVTYVPEVLDTLIKKLNPSYCALLVIDVQNDFCADGGRASRHGRDLSPVQLMLPRVTALLNSARASGVLVVFLRKIYETPNNWYLSGAWLDMASRRDTHHATDSTEAMPPTQWEDDYFGEIRPRPSEPVITKHRYSGFFQTELDLVLRVHGIRSVVVTGVSTDVCVDTTVRDGFMRDYYMVIARDATAAYNEQDHEASLRCIERHFGQVVTTGEILDTWR